MDSCSNQPSRGQNSEKPPLSSTSVLTITEWLIVVCGITKLRQMEKDANVKRYINVHIFDVLAMLPSLEERNNNKLWTSDQNTKNTLMVNTTDIPSLYDQSAFHFSLDTTDSGVLHGTKTPAGGYVCWRHQSWFIRQAEAKKKRQGDAFYI